MNIVAIANQKGGVGKTTTALNLGTALAAKGHNVCLIDLDPQGNLSEYLQYKSDGDPTMAELMTFVSTGELKNELCAISIRHNEVNNVDYVPADISLAGAEQRIITALSRETILKRLLAYPCFAKYDFILIDCLPSLGILLVNALTVANNIIVPSQTQKFSADGLASLTELVKQVKATLNPELYMCGIVPTMVDNTNVSKNAIAKFREEYGVDVCQTVIHRSVEACKSSEMGKALTLTKNKLGMEYVALADELERKMNNG